MLLVFQVDQLQDENASLEQRIQGHQMRTQTMELELDKNSKKWKEKEISLLKEIDQLHIKVEEAMVIGQMGSPGSPKQNKANPAHQDYPVGSESAHDSATTILTHAQATTAPQGGVQISEESLEAAEKRRERDLEVLNVLQTLSATLMSMSQSQAESVCGEIARIKMLFDQTPTARMLLKAGEGVSDLNRVSETRPEEILTRWMTAHLKHALKNGDLPDGATVLVNNLSTDLDDGIILLDFLNLILPDAFKWPAEHVESMRIASRDKIGELLSSTMADFTQDTTWQELQLFDPENSFENRTKILSLLFLLSSGMTDGWGGTGGGLKTGVWGCAQQLAKNKVMVEEAARRLEEAGKSLLNTVKTARDRYSHAKCVREPSKILKQTD